MHRELSNTPKTLAHHLTGFTSQQVIIRKTNFPQGYPNGEWYIPVQTQVDRTKINKAVDQSDLDTLFEKDPRVIIYLHGGAMVLCSPKTHRDMLLRLSGKTGTIVLAVQYRKPPEHPFPIPVNDCYSIYKAILQFFTQAQLHVDGFGDEMSLENKHGTLPAVKEDSALPTTANDTTTTTESKENGTQTIDDKELEVDESEIPSIKKLNSRRPWRIYVAGDSAGGTLTASLCVKARANGLPLPHGLIYISPWVDLDEELDEDKPDSSIFRYKSVDFLPPASLPFYAAAYAADARKKDLSPINFDLSELPPSLVLFGEFEMLYDQQMRFVEKLKKCGVHVQYHVGIGMVHVYPLFAAVNVPEALQAFDSIVEFIKSIEDGTIKNKPTIDVSPTAEEVPSPVRQSSVTVNVNEDKVRRHLLWLWPEPEDGNRRTVFYHNNKTQWSNNLLRYMFQQIL